MLSVKAVISTYCFVESPSGLAQVLWLDLESTEDEDVEAWVEGVRVACPVRWQGRLAAGAPSALRWRSWLPRAPATVTRCRSRQ